MEHVFSAAHSVRIGNVPEPLHGHNWHVTAAVTADELDGDGFVCDFHAVEQALASVCEPFQNRTLNDCSLFTDVNPSAEQVARVIADVLGSRLQRVLAGAAQLKSVRVTEAPGCAATFFVRASR